MDIKEYYTTRGDGVKLYRTYSDQGFLILQVETGIQYDEAIDVENAPYTYSETSILPEQENTSDEISDSEALNIIVGGNTNDEE